MGVRKEKNKTEKYANDHWEVRVSSNPNLSLADKKRLLQECVDFLLSLNSKGNLNNK